MYIDDNLDGTITNSAGGVIEGIAEGSSATATGIYISSTLSATGSQISGLMLFSLMLGMVGMVLLFWWLLIHRFRLQYLEARIDELGLDQAIAQRRAEAGPHAGQLATGGS